MVDRVNQRLSDVPVTDKDAVVAVERELRPVLKKVRHAVNQLIDDTPWLTGVLIEESLSSGTNSIEHELGKEPSGFILVDMKRGSGETTAAHVFRRDDDTWSDTEVELYATDSCDVKIWLW